MPFSFKQFHIDDSHCGMKVSSDAVLLGAWARVSEAARILDIGTGCGLLALMSAQRSAAEVFAVELESRACRAAKSNFEMSPWAERITIVEDDIINFAGRHVRIFDHIICNPPYFLTGPQTRVQQRANARHVNTLSFEALIHAAGTMLTDDGLASLILPVEVSDAFFALVDKSGLSLTRVQQVIPVSGKTPRRVLFSLSKTETETVRLTPLVLRDPQNRYTAEAAALTQDFYLSL